MRLICSHFKNTDTFRAILYRVSEIYLTCIIIYSVSWHLEFRTTYNEATTFRKVLARLKQVLRRTHAINHGQQTRTEAAPTKSTDNEYKYAGNIVQKEKCHYITSTTWVIVSQILWDQSTIKIIINIMQKHSFLYIVRVS